MEESNKLPLKRVEFSLTKFNDVAIPHHLDLLRQHKANILKYESLGELSRVRAEQVNAGRVTSQLRSLLGELEALRRQVQPQDLPKFDALTQRPRDNTLKAIMDYLDTSPLAINRANASSLYASRADVDVGAGGGGGGGVSAAGGREGGGGADALAVGSAVSTDSVGVVAHQPGEGDAQIQLQLEEEALVSRSAVLAGWAELQRDVHELHAAWHALHAAAHAQADATQRSHAALDAAATNVLDGRKTLAIAEKLRVGGYGLCGAALGALAGGPAGLVAGGKAGLAAAAAGSLLGYLGATLLGKRGGGPAPPPPPPTRRPPPTTTRPTTKEERITQLVHRRVGSTNDAGA